jgi:hypothetical protein
VNFVGSVVESSVDLHSEFDIGSSYIDVNGESTWRQDWELTQPKRITVLERLGEFQLGVTHSEGHFIWSTQYHSSETSGSVAPHFHGTTSKFPHAGNGDKFSIQAVFISGKQCSVIDL